jgi:hypothetical protein
MSVVASLGFGDPVARSTGNEPASRVGFLGKQIFVPKSKLAYRPANPHSNAMFKAEYRQSEIQENTPTSLPKMTLIHLG